MRRRYTSVLPLPVTPCSEHRDGSARSPRGRRVDRGAPVPAWPRRARGTARGGRRGGRRLDARVASPGEAGAGGSPGSPRPADAGSTRRRTRAARSRARRSGATSSTTVRRAPQAVFGDLACASARATTTPTFAVRPKGTTTRLPRGGIEALRHPEIEGLLEGDVESDAGDFHARAKPLFRGTAPLWISL